MKNKIWILVAMAAALQGCSHSEMEKQVDEQVAQETTIKSRSALNAESGQMIQSTPGLTSEQRARLSALRETTLAQSEALRLQSLRLRSVLIKNMVGKNYSEEKTSIIKAKIKSVEEQRLSLTFDAVEQANQVLGHENNADHERIMNDFFEGYRGHD